jgi:molybdopterin molybdotransferase
MLAFDEARRVILDAISPLEAESAELLDALGRTLAEDVIAPWNLPPFDNSAMDGYAVRAADCTPGCALPIVGYIAAGIMQLPLLAPGTAIRIMTGAPVPAGCDAVVPVEQVEDSGGLLRPTVEVAVHQHVRFAGEDVRQGERILAAGTTIRPHEIHMLASCGQERVQLHRRPTVAIVSTGDELVPLGELPTGGRIVNSNAYALAASVAATGAIPVAGGIAQDNAASHRERLSAGLAADVLITSAGVSSGDRDLVRDILDELGVQIVFWRVAIKPGKEIAFGLHQGKPVFSLPGNPVSAMLTFEEFVAPALRLMTGHPQPVRPLFTATLVEELRKKPGLTNLVRLRVEYANGGFIARSAGRQESGILRTTLAANAIGILPAARESFARGEAVEFHFLDGGTEMVAAPTVAMPPRR